MVLTKRSLLAAGLAVVSTRSMAQAWPTKPIRMIVPLAPGATADIVARVFAEELGKSLGQTIVVDNKTGAGGTIATAELARAPADGYTMGLVSQGTMVFNIGLYKTPGYDPLKHLAMVAVTGGVSNVLIVSPDNPARTVADLLAQARAKPGELTYSSGGVGTSHHMSGVLLELRTGVKLQHVPYRATPAGIQAVANGEVAMGLFNTPTVIGLIKGGKLKALAVTSEQRSTLLPDAPTMIEAGVKEYVVNTWMGFAVPAGVPEPVITRLNAEINRIGQSLARPEMSVAKCCRSWPRGTSRPMTSSRWPRPARSACRRRSATNRC
jgi:tripartite-type tricarboxylate transporter receptor subunit TctC